MTVITRDELYSLEEYAALRPEFREKVMAHKRDRRVQIGPNATLYFEDHLTIQYQVQEMLRIERIFESDAIEEELAAYNPLIPDGTNWKATFMLEYEDEQERRRALAGLTGIEKRVWIKIGDHTPVYPITNEDMERETEEKTSAVHFMRFEFTPDMLVAFKADEPVSMGIDHPKYNHTTSELPQETMTSLKQDLR